MEGHGYTRSHIPSPDELVGFANYDLKMNGLPIIERLTDGELGIVVEFGQSPLILNIMRRHGFEFKRDG